MPISTNVDNLEEHKEQARVTKEKIDSVEHVDLSKILTIGGVLAKQREKSIENVVIESDLKQNDDGPQTIDARAEDTIKFDEIKKELSVIKATATKLRTYIDKELKKTKEEIKLLKKKE